MVEERCYIAFILGYDLFHDEFANSERNETDLVFNVCLEIADDFLASEYNNREKDLYSCLVCYLINCPSFERFEKEYGLYY